jgi:RNA polymerase sigma-70 factor, ECF subfamily
MQSAGLPCPDSLTVLLDAARLGSTEAVGKLFDGCRQYLLLIANKEVDEALAVKVAPSDLVQETFIKGFREFKHFDGKTEGSLLAWLRQILINAIADRARQYHGTEKRELARESSLEAATNGHLHGNLAAINASPSSEVAAREQDDLLQRALRRLPIERQQVIRWRNYDRISFEEIGQRLGRSPEAARKVWTRALHDLQVLLEFTHGAEG